MADYNINLGVEVDVGNIQSQINKVKVDPIKVNLDVKGSKSEIRDIKRQLSGMNFSNSSINKITKDLENMNLSVSKVTTNLKKNGNIEISVNGLDKLNRSISLVREYTKGGDLLNGKKISQSFKTEIDEINEAFNLLKRKQKEIGSLEFKLAGLDSKENAAEIKTITSQIRGLKREYDKLYSGYGDRLSKSQNTELTKGFQDTANKVKQLKSQMRDEIQLKINTGDFDRDISDIESKIKNLGNISEGLRKNITQLKSNKTRMTNALGKGDIDAAVKAYERYQNLLKTVNNQVGINRNAQSSIDADFDKLTKLAQQIDRINKKAATLDPKVNSNQIAELSSQLEEAEAAYNSLYSKLQGKMTSNQLDSLSESANKADKELKELEAKITDTKTKLASGIKLKLGDGTFDNDISNVTSKFDKLRNKSAELEAAMREVNTALSGMKIASDNGDIDGLIKANQNYERALKSVKNQIDINTRAERDSAAQQKLIDDRTAFQSKIDAWLTKNSAAVKKFGSSMLELKAQAESCDRVTLNHLKSQFDQLDAEAGAAGLKVQSLGDRIKTQFQKYSQYFSVASVLMYATQGLKDMFDQVVAIDTAMTELKKVTDESDASYNQFLSNAASRAKEIGTTIDGLVTSTADFARLGYSFEESQGLAEVANIYTVVGDEIEGVEGATSSLISTLAAFKDEMNGMSDSDFAMSIVDKFNEVSNNFAISSGGIGEAMSRSASSLAAANNTLDESIALITAANEVTQNPEKVGNAMKTKF